MDIIYGVSVMGGGEDNMCWQPAKSRGFEVSSYYQVFNTASNHSFPWKCIWKPKVPYSPLEKISTIDNLRKEMFGYWIIGVICVKITGNQKTICYFIVLLLLS